MNLSLLCFSSCIIKRSPKSNAQFSRNHDVVNHLKSPSFAETKLFKYEVRHWFTRKVPFLTSALCQVPLECWGGARKCKQPWNKEGLSFVGKSIAQPAPCRARHHVHGKPDPLPNSQEWQPNLYPISSSFYTWVADYAPSTPEQIPTCWAFCTSHKGRDPGLQSLHAHRQTTVCLPESRSLAYLHKPHYLMDGWMEPATWREKICAWRLTESLGNLRHSKQTQYIHYSLW